MFSKHPLCTSVLQIRRSNAIALRWNHGKTSYKAWDDPPRQDVPPKTRGLWSWLRLNSDLYHSGDNQKSLRQLNQLKIQLGVGFFFSKKWGFVNQK